MNWDWQSADETFLWHHMGPVNDLMSGIKLDEENWHAMPPIVSNNKAVEVLYLRNFVEDNYRAVGAVSNRTYNYYTQATDSPCNNVPAEGSEIDTTEIYQDMTFYISTVAMQVLVMPDMGDEVEYKINWYNAMNGDPIETVTETSLENGWLPLHFPLLSGNASSPILFFEIYRSSESTFKSAEADTSAITENQILPVNEMDTLPAITAVTNWENLDHKTNSELISTDYINVSPNPNNGIVNVKLSSDYFLSSEWKILNSLGEVVTSGIVESLNFEIDFESYPNGIYYLNFITQRETYANKIIKQ